MAIESDADRLAMLVACGQVAYLFSAPNTTTVYGVLDREYVEVNGVECEMPRLMIRTSDSSGVVHGTPVTVNAQDFTVIGIQPDGQGMTMLVMQDQ